MIDKQVKASEIQGFLTLENMDQFTNLLIPLEDVDANSIAIGGIWGEFTLLRNEIDGGVRFQLKECPNALTWTVTTGHPPSPNRVVIHLSINRLQKSQQFVDEIEEFLSDHAEQISSISFNCPYVDMR